jgi:predicted nucleic acid-binding protein
MLLDASVWVAATDTDDRHRDACIDLIRSPEARFAALDLTTIEVVNAMSRRGRQATRAAVEAIHLRTAGDLASLDRRELDLLADLTTATPLTAYDGAYVVAAASNGWQLVSLDHKDLVDPGWAITPAEALERLGGTSRR